MTTLKQKEFQNNMQNFILQIFGKYIAFKPYKIFGILL